MNQTTVGTRAGTQPTKPQPIFAWAGGGATTYDAWKEADMQTLCATLQNIKGNFVLTVNDNHANREIFSMFHLQSIGRQRGIANKSAGDRKIYRELIIRSK